jgi:PBSX family phage terminase large subunit
MASYNIEPTPKQQEFITSDARYTCYSGGFGAGKTMGGCLRGLLLSQFPGNFGLVGRSTYIELRDTTRRTFFEVCPPEFYDESGGGQWKPSENHLKLINGSEIIFRHLDTISEKELLSLNLGWFFIDQAEEIGERVFQTLQSRLRLATVPNRFGFIVCNPEPGNWIYMNWRKPIEEGKPKPDHHLVESSSFDNPYLPKDYLQSLLASYPAEMQKRFIEGRWDAFENQIFPEFDRNIHAINPFDIPNDWEKIVAVDHGLVNPTAALFTAIDYDGNIIVFDEYYAPGIVSDHARNIIAKTQDKEISMWVIDPSTQAKTREKDGMPWSVIEEYEDYGLFFTPANNEKLASINRVKEFLKLSPLRRHIQTNITPAPRLYIFKNCVNLLWELPQYQWRKLRGLSQRNAPEQARDFNDHAIDALRYMIMSRFPAPVHRTLGSSLILPEDRKNFNLMTTPMSPSLSGDEELGSFYSGDKKANSFEDIEGGI